MSNLTAADFLDELRRELARLQTLLASVSPAGWEASVTSCPAWTVADLIRHLGGVHRKITQAVRAQGRSRSSIETPEVDDQLGEWLQGGGRALLAALDADPATPAWTFDSAHQTLGFWQERMALETTLHRVDAEAALGKRTAIPARLAVAGVAEVIEVMVRLGVVEGRLDLPDYAITLHATDTGDTWKLGHGTVVGTVSGEAEQLLLCCWRRANPQRVLALDGDSSRVLDLLARRLTP